MERTRRPWPVATVRQRPTAAPAPREKPRSVEVLARTLLRRADESALDRHQRHQRSLDETVSHFLRLVRGDDQDARIGHTGSVEGFRQGASGGLGRGGGGGVILLFGATRPEMAQQVGHGVPFVGSSVTSEGSCRLQALMEPAQSHPPGTSSPRPKRGGYFATLPVFAWEGGNPNHDDLRRLDRAGRRRRATDPPRSWPLCARA